MQRLRNNIGFWILGLCNNYGYVIMLSAAFDILSRNFNENEDKKTDQDDEPFCNPMSTGAILIADIIPSLCIKLLSPVLPLGANLRVILVVIFSVLSYLMTALSFARWVSFLGVIFASASSGLGEATFLSYSSRFSDSDTISFWSSGTGGAGLIGSISYAGLTQLGLSPRVTLLVMLIVPVIMAITFWIVLAPPKIDVATITPLMQPNEPSTGDEIISYQTVREPEIGLTLREKSILMKGLLGFMIPLAVVYFAEYLINQALFELVYFPGIWLSHNEQYRWYQVDYQLGVLISRSSVKWIKIKALWILPLLQIINLLLVFVEALKNYLPNIWIMLLIVFYEGLLGGAAYVNTFDQIYRKYEDRVRGFCLGAASIADALGITLSGFSSVLLHNVLCDIISKKQR
ncbi:battenin isoform X2 [Tetranychus urticae]|nr:battenin isoform X2 [Tetranychus urticae]